MTTVLLAGATGVFGRHIRRRLDDAGYDVLGLGRGSGNSVRADLNDREMLIRALREKKIDTVMHFAAHAYVGESVANPRKYFQNNVLDGLTLLHAVLDANVRKFVFSSSCATYGVPSKVPITEDMPQFPVNPYGVTKLIFEQALKSYSPAYGLNYVSLRYFNAAGADENGLVGEIHKPETHLIPSAFEAIRGERAALDIFGDKYPTPDGTCVRDYIHVSDLAEGHVQALEYLDAGSSIAINLGTGRGHSIREVLATIKSVTGREVPSRTAPARPGDPPELVADPTRAEKVLGWKAKRSLEQIVATAWKWAERPQPTKH